MILSLIIPCFNEEANIYTVYAAINEVVVELPIDEYELIFVDDGSKDKTLSKIKSLCQSDNKIKYISFSRNFGKEAAMLAGLEQASGDRVSILDADMQDPPSLLIEMFSIMASQDCDCVGCYRTDRKGEPFFRSFFAKQFYKIINKLSGIEIPNGGRDFRLMKQNMVYALLELKEKSRFSKGLFSWVGFKTIYIKYNNINRNESESKWSFSDLLRYSITGIISFSTAPLQFVSVVGIIFCLIAVLLILWIFIQKLFIGIDIQGWASMMTILIMLSGIQLLSLGIVGQYISKIFDEVKSRPQYIIREKNFNDDFIPQSKL